MPKVKSDDLAIDALLKLRMRIDRFLNAVNGGVVPENGDQLIDVIEDELLGLDGEAHNIFTDLASRNAETLETQELIESKKENI